jgi:RimJ/RimL family protein N-acetyltransferase
VSLPEVPSVDNRRPGGLRAHPSGSEVVALQDGTAVAVRLIHPDDAPRLKALYARLSPESLFFRFLELRKGLSDAEACSLANVDHNAEIALLAARIQRDEEKIIAVARYALIPTAESGLAELSIVVEDRYQGRGLGALLLKRLVAYARSHGVRTFLAVVHPENARMLRLIGHSGLPTESKVELGALEIRIRLQRTAEPREVTGRGQRSDSSLVRTTAPGTKIP